MQYDLGSVTNVASNPLLTVTITNKYITVVGQYTNATANAVGFFKTYTAPATQTVHWAGEPCFSAAKNYPGLLQLCFKDSTGKMATFTVYDNSASSDRKLGLASSKFNSDLSFSADYFAVNLIPATPWLRIIDDNTNRICQVSGDGVSWVTFHTVSRTDFLTPTQMGWRVNFAGSTAGTVPSPAYETTVWSVEGP
jgi:hypothetical protein